MEEILKQVTCKNCGNAYPITREDLAFYEEMKVPEPVNCPDCRQQRRLAWRNERTLYSRKCDATGTPTLSVFSPDKKVVVYKNDYWYSDQWNAFSYAQDFDFTRPFFQQFQDLLQRVPQLALSTVNTLNCDYVNQCGWSKNCYLIFEADNNENCLYANNMFDCKTCIDNLHVYDCELCYQCIDCRQCYNLKFSQNCSTCTESWFLKNCIGCMNCFGCVNLRNKQYYIYNQKYSKEEYFEKLKLFPIDTVEGLQSLQETFLNYAKQFPHKSIFGVQNEDSSGDYLFNTQRCNSCFDVSKGQDSKYVFNAQNVKKVHDMMVFGHDKGVEYCYENHEIGDSVRNVCFSDQVWSGVSNVWYSKLCMQNSHDLFGCIGLRKASYCILNKQYTKEEYEVLLPKVIAHMQSTGEWGNGFPIWLSPFCYNETCAQEYYPLSKEQALANGYPWKDEDVKISRPATVQAPLRMSETPDTLVNEVLACSECKKNYKIVAQELTFYRTQNLPIPRKCHDCRHKDRMKQRNPRRLWNRNCMKCGNPIQTSFAPERPEPVFCEPCYLASVD